MTLRQESQAKELVALSASPHWLAGVYVYLPCFLLFWLIAPIPVAVYEYFRLKNTRYTVSNERIICESGIFSKTVEQVEIYRIRDLVITRSFLERIFDVGSVTVISTDKTASSLELQCIPNVMEVKEHIRHCTEHLRSTKRRIV